MGYHYLSRRAFCENTVETETWGWVLSSIMKDDEAPDVAGRQPQHNARVDLCQLLFHRLANDMYPPELLHNYHDPVLSDHPALLVRAGSLSVKRTFLSWRKRTLSFLDYTT